jgi:metal-responsive CopG/Arc/MetJ family transcriptional regulator
MNTYKISLTMNTELLNQIDFLIREKKFPNRNSFIQEAVREKLQRLSRFRLAIEAAKLDPEEEKAFAEEGMNYLI